MNDERNMENELKRAKRFGVAASVLIVILLMMLCYMNISIRGLAKEYDRLEESYEVLYESLIGGEE